VDQRQTAPPARQQAGHLEGLVGPTPKINGGSPSLSVGMNFAQHATIIAIDP
jgi:hypothetical protein